jgi:hypothetical protein
VNSVWPATQVTKEPELANSLSECQFNNRDLRLWFAVDDRVILMMCES